MKTSPPPHPPGLPPLLLTPGPVPVPPEVLEALAMPVLHHRTPEFQKRFDRIHQALPKVFATSQRTFVQVATGSGGMESLIANTLSPGEKVGVVVSGKFGERWADIAGAYGAHVERLSIEWGQSLEIAAFEAWLKAHPNLRLVLSQVCETSTGALHPVREMAQAVRRLTPDALFLVDAITALGAMPMAMDEWGLDGVVGGSQKAFMLPAGLTFVALSERAWKRCESAKAARYYFDLRSERKANERGETGFSAAVPLMTALDVVLQQVEALGGWPKVHARIAALSQATREGCKRMGLTLFARTPAPSLTAIAVPAAIDGDLWRTHLEKDHRIIVMGGQDLLKGKILRIGHMGYITDEDLLRTLRALGESAAKLSGGKLPVSEADIDAACENARVLLEASPLPWKAGVPR